MAKLHYLTVQDILWINLQVTKKVQHFSYARLEEATYYQYAYGDSNEVVSQAGRFLAGFLKMRPLDAGNEATAFVGMVAFLRINGIKLRLDDGATADWVLAAASSVESAREVLSTVAEVDSHHHHDEKPATRAAIQNVLECYSSTVAELSATAVAV